MFFACGVVQAVYAARGYRALITAALDSHDSDPIAIHREGRACDFRVHMLKPDELIAIFDELETVLNPLGFDVLYEDKSTPNEHIHIEWDPKGTESIFTKES